MERPTLPSIHSLSLPTIYPRGYTSSPTSSRSPSPSSQSTSTPPHKPTYTHKLRLVPSTLELADAVVLVPPPSFPGVPALPTLPPCLANLAPRPDSAHIRTTPSVHPTRPQPPQALLLLGPALRHLRHPTPRIARGARVHPYRIVRGDGQPWSYPRPRPCELKREREGSTGPLAHVPIARSRRP